MKFLTLLAATALSAVGVQAAPTKDWHDAKCLTTEYATYLVNQEIVFLQHVDLPAAQAAAAELFADDIIEYGDSINSLRGDPLGTQVEYSAEIYINNTLSTPPIPKIVTVDIVNNCDRIVWQWQFYGIGQGPNERIAGYTTIKVDLERPTKQIYYQYVEFNSLAWAANIGFTIAPPTTGPFAPGGSR